MDNLKAFDTEQLEAELERRREEEEARNKPQPLADPNWFYVEKMCTSYVEELSIGQRPHGDSKHYIFEAAMEAVFGREVWGWINKRSR